MLMTMASSYTNPLLPVFTSTVAAALLPTDANHTATTTCTIFKRVKIEERTRRRRRRWGVLSSSDNQTVVEAPATTPSSSSPPAGESPSSEVVRNFYGGINGRDLASVEELIAHNCVYEDLIFSRPFVGRKVSLSLSLSRILFPIHFFSQYPHRVQPQIFFGLLIQSIVYWEMPQVCIACNQLGVHIISFEFITFICYEFLYLLYEILNTCYEILCKCY